jgi:hypothetical protein
MAQLPADDPHALSARERVHGTQRCFREFEVTEAAMAAWS